MNKYTEKSLEIAGENVAKIKEFIDEMGALDCQDKETFWKKFKSILKKYENGHIEKILDTLNEKNTGEHPGAVLNTVKFYAGGILMIRDMVDAVEKTPDKIAEATSLLEKQKAVYEQIKTNIEAQ